MGGTRNYGGFTLVELLTTIGIGAVLTGLLLPAILTARERARRTVCLNNLHQIGMAMQSYCSDYDGYFPSWAVWGQQPYELYDQMLNCLGICDAGCYSDCNGETADSVGGGFLAGGAFMDFNNQDQAIIYRTIFTGENANGHEAQVGHLQKAPVGLGYLLTGEYVGDVGVFYCPTSDGMPAPELEGGRPNAATQLRDFRTIGGRDSHAVLYGDYAWLPIWNTNINYGRTILSHYHYRLLPTAIQPCRYWREFFPELARVRMLYTKPDRVFSIGEPVFKSEKQLGDRAFVTDSWSKNIEDPTHVGDGIFGHKEGYNVLYGDSSASWFGDPSRRIMWLMPQTTSPDFSGSEAVQASMAANVISDYVSAVPGTLTELYAPGLNVAVWHLFDMNHGLDVGVDEAEWENGNN